MGKDDPRLIGGRWVRVPLGGWPKPPKAPPARRTVGFRREALGGAMHRLLVNRLNRLAGDPGGAKGGRRRPKGGA